MPRKPKTEEPTIPDMTDEDAVDTDPPSPDALIRGFRARATNPDDQHELAAFIIAKIRREWIQRGND